MVHLVVDYNVIMARFPGRRQCPACGALYNVISSAPQSEGLCDTDGTKLMIRDDDREEVVREQLASLRTADRRRCWHFSRSRSPCWDVTASGDAPQAIATEIVRVDPERRAAIAA